MNWVVCRQTDQGSVLKRITLAVAGTCPLKFSTEPVGGMHVKIRVDSQCDSEPLCRCLAEIWKEVIDKWISTQYMLARKGFTCYMMIEESRIKQFIGTDGIGIRKLRKLNKCSVFVLPILFRPHRQEPSIFFEIWTKPNIQSL